ncbi:aminodeoxychorismate lyase [Pedobacter psychrophilus]|uniref:Endolytic murein transglycosylase n=1 Tax=Pedobacter psychrophilus TaxID=1826909 RepID=A0A179DHW0_9SPHI|nr:endolytic transglycosylase MltG [Pedobacter psychrophilus]OAQ40611.1 aminodeoxychorismate lyase [Pedobacter psychrophilus]
MDNHQKKGGSVALILIVLIVLACVLILPGIYRKYLKANTNIDSKTYLYIPTNATYQQVLDSIDKHQLLKDKKTFLNLAQDREYSSKIKSGKYPFKKGMNNRQILNMLIAGNQEPVQVGFRNIRLKENFAATAAKKLEFDSTSLINLIDSVDFIKNYGFTKDNIYTLFIPNSYEMYWNISAKDFFERMNKEYEKFWTDERRNKAKEIDLSPQEVTVLASIVDSEALMDKEMPTIAGLYLNRLKRGIKLEADPTVIFANNDFSIRRVLNKQLRKDSPYNTYLYKGLPPGPIMMPSIAAIDAVLNHENHNYIYMCAKEDFSGYHNFADNLKDHLANAKRFQQALNERNIKK